VLDSTKGMGKPRGKIIKTRVIFRLAGIQEFHYDLFAARARLPQNPVSPVRNKCIGLVVGGAPSRRKGFQPLSGLPKKLRLNQAAGRNVSCFHM